jgi:SAM-dependent methyltransferase
MGDDAVVPWSAPVSEPAARRRRDRDWDDAYRGTPGWDIGRPQPIFVRLAEGGALTGRLLDVGCGTGQNALLAAEHGADVTGVDISPLAVERATAEAGRRGLAARFLVADALRLDALGEQFDTLIDCGAFHTFDDADRGPYVASLSAVTRPGGRLHLACFSDRMPGDWGPRRVTEAELRAAFADGWTAESVEPAAFDLAPGLPVPQAQAWSATFRRTP